MKIIWRKIHNYPLYKINNKGDVVKQAYIKYIHRNGHLVALHMSKRKVHSSKRSDGYLAIGLSNRHGKRVFKLHRLVAKTFISNPHHYPDVNHKNCQRDDDCVSNLEWCSYKYNRHYGACPLKQAITELGNASLYKQCMSNYDYKIAQRIQHLAQQTSIYKNRSRNHI